MKATVNRTLLLILAALALPRVSAQDIEHPTTMESLQERVNSVPKTHPRLMADAAVFESLRKSIGQSSSTRDLLAQAVKHHADLLDNVPPIKRQLKGRRLLGNSRCCLERMLNLSMAYQLTGETKYVQRGKQEMLAVAAFSDWNPTHFLDVAEITLAMAIGYDWMFDELDETSRTTIRQAIAEKGVSLPFESEHNRWVTASNNWGQVCHCGLTAGALAILEDEPELAAKTVLNAIQNVPNSMKAFSPKGGYPEGPSYWAYGTSFNVVLLESLNSALGSDFGLSQIKGFDQTGQYPSLLTGPSGEAFNYADGSANRDPEPVLYWFANHYNRPDWLLGEDTRLRTLLAGFQSDHAGTGRNRLLPLALLWMNKSEPDLQDSEIKMPLNWQSESATAVSVHRSSWTDHHATFVGVKAGSPSGPHGQMDIGSFVLDTNGVRWAIDLGAENYHSIESRGMNLWSSAQDSDRWTIFRQSNSAHNTLVIDGKLQVAKGHAKITEFSDAPKSPFSVVDLSPTYKGQADQVLRGIYLLPSRVVRIEDNLMRPQIWEPSALGDGHPCGCGS